MSADRHDHRQAVWTNRHPEQLSWHQDRAASLTAAFSPAFVPVDFTPEQHTTPAGVAQRFIYGRLRRSR